MASKKAVGKHLLVEEKLQAEINKLKNLQELHHISAWRENVQESVISRVQIKNEKSLVKEMKHNTQTCNMIRRALLQYQTECDYTQYEKELNERGLTFHKDRLS